MDNGLSPDPDSFLSAVAKYDEPNVIADQRKGAHCACVWHLRAAGGLSFMVLYWFNEWQS